MLTKLFAVTTIGVVATSILAAYTQRSAFQLRQERQPNYWSRRSTTLSGGYRRGIWVVSPTRSSYGSFRGGSLGVGK
ncbi:MAG: hypothetical protein HC851_15550 [Acaryochloris sp. RU_4_1]|nr:hypothetical protein [Acaryochloris sp. SU_5_25]NJM66975.1 hypothetical protein [Acaryochloris sp. RU_4_1]NJR55802.1 hypothetical protein [Acaryochloris sp. CRU_2_0]